MALHSANVGLLMDGINMAAYFRSFAMEASQAVHSSTVLGLSAETKLPGLKMGTASGEAFVDETSNVGSFDYLKSKYTGASPGSGAPAIVSRCLTSNSFAVGSRVDMGYFHEASLSFAVVISDLQKVTFNGEPDQDAIDYGVSLHSLSAETGTVNGTTVNNGAASSNGGVAVLHVTAISGAAPSVVIKIQHSTDGSTWVDEVTFSASTAANTVQRSEVAAGTTVRQYQRIVCTFGGTTSSITFQVSFARR